MLRPFYESSSTQGSVVHVTMYYQKHLKFVSVENPNDYLAKKKNAV